MVMLFLEHYLFVMKTGKVETQILNDGDVILGTLLVCDDARKSQILGTLLYDDGCVQPITNRLYDNDTVMLYFEH